MEPLAAAIRQPPAAAAPEELPIECSLDANAHAVAALRALQSLMRGTPESAAERKHFDTVRHSM